MICVSLLARAWRISRLLTVLHSSLSFQRQPPGRSRNTCCAAEEPPFPGSENVPNRYLCENFGDLYASAVILVHPLTAETQPGPMPQQKASSVISHRSSVIG